MSSKIALCAGLRVITLPGRRRIASATLPLLEKRTIKVPTMGDSITEACTNTVNLKFLQSPFALL